ncbi:MAG: DEAD/DEAH box helicase, partial [Candidatus Levyibacteriota bacterium]
MTYTRNHVRSGTNRFGPPRNGYGANRRGFMPRRGPQATFNPTRLVSEMDAAPKVQAQIDYVPTHTFQDLIKNPILLGNVTRKGYTVPTPIQDQSIPSIQEGKDLIGIANTGTGKTAAFLIPLIEKILANRQGYEKVLIVAPTRELATQIDDEFFAFSKGLGMYSVLCIGGVKIHRQKMNLRRGYNIVIGTPGRIKDLIRERCIDLSEFKTVVLDEADHMVDIGFLPDIKFIISYLPRVRQSLFFSATVDGKVKEVINTFVANPVTVSVRTATTAENVEQRIIKVIHRDKKIEQLHDLLIQKEFSKVLIFGKTKWGVQKLSQELIERGFRADAIHGNKSQNQRQRTLDRFKRNEIQVLLATDVASRGLDIDSVSHVINYDLPSS